jgi:hypothetical protein
MRSDVVAAHPPQDDQGSRRSAAGARARWNVELERAFLQALNQDRSSAAAAQGDDGGGADDARQAKPADAAAVTPGQGATMFDRSDAPIAWIDTVPAAYEPDADKAAPQAGAANPGDRSGRGARPAEPFFSWVRTVPAGVRSAPSAGTSRASPVLAGAWPGNQPAKRHMHTVFGAHGVTVFVRDADITPNGISRLLASLASGFAKEGRKVVELHVNGRRVYVHPEARPARADEPAVRRTA